MYSIFYYNMINIRVLLIIRVLIILKYVGGLDFECYIYIYIYIYMLCICYTYSDIEVSLYLKALVTYLAIRHVARVHVILV